MTLRTGSHGLRARAADADMSAESDDYKQQVMLTCKILLDSLSEGRKLDLLAPQGRRKLQFVARIVRLGDTFTSDSTKPIYGMLFTTEGEEYLMRKANEFGLKPMTRVKVTIQPIEGDE